MKFLSLIIGAAIVAMALVMAVYGVHLAWEGRFLWGALYLMPLCLARALAAVFALPTVQS